MSSAAERTLRAMVTLFVALRLPVDARPTAAPSALPKAAPPLTYGMAGKIALVGLVTVVGTLVALPVPSRGETALGRETAASYDFLFLLSVYRKLKILWVCDERRHVVEGGEVRKENLAIKG